MTYRFLGRLHVWLAVFVSTFLSRLRVAPQRGQGTVEYVALILLVAAVLATAVALAGKANFNLATIVTEKLKGAIDAVGGKK
jgi:uncharacterized protein YggU (UPF0235/DUF167 family)